MCIGKALIIIKGNRHPQYVMEENDHSPLIEKFNLNDNQEPMLKNFVRIEMLPLGSLTSKNPKHWECHIDEIKELPLWFEDKQDDWIFKCHDLMQHVIIPAWIKDGVGGSLDLRYTKVSDLGKLMFVGESLDLQGTKVSDLGELTSVGRYLDLRGTKVDIQSLPKKLRDKCVF